MTVRQDHTQKEQVGRCLRDELDPRSVEQLPYLYRGQDSRADMLIPLLPIAKVRVGRPVERGEKGVSGPRDVWGPAVAQKY